MTAPRPFWGTRDGLVDVGPVRPVHAIGETRVLTQLQIEEAFARFGLAHDENRIHALMSVFTADARIEFGSGSGAAVLTFRGVDEIRREFSRRLPTRRGQKRHCITNVVVEQFGGDTAVAIAYGIVTRAASAVRVQSSVLYRAEMRRCADGFWRFELLFIGVDDYAGDE